MPTILGETGTRMRNSTSRTACLQRQIAVHLMWSLPVPNDSSPQTLHLPASITLHCSIKQRGSKL
jgi:hypothetical protein